MNAKKFQLSAIIGRFQPLHRAHEDVIAAGLAEAERVLVLVGSANRARCPRNPWTYEERAAMIRSVFHFEVEMGRLIIQPLNDFVYSDVGWMSAVRDIVKSYEVPDENIGLLGFKKDNSSYYLNMFPEWDSHDIKSGYATFNATDIRKQYLRPTPILPERICSPKIVDFLEKFMFTDEFKSLVAEQKMIHDYRKSWEHSPFPPTFNTVDAVVVQSGHILLVTRGEMPGKGLLAFPGGYVKVDETLIDSCVRELKEETQIADGISKKGIPDAVLKSMIRRTETFDDPHRSARGRVITQAYLFELPNKKEMYTIKGSDDAAYADWYPISELHGQMMFEDHYFIMCKMLGITMD